LFTLHLDSAYHLVKRVPHRPLRERTRTMTREIAPLFDYLRPLEEAVAEIANTWRPDDPEYRADVYRQIMMQFSYGYFAFFHADAEHPDWAPLWNPVYTLQPNPDDIYRYCPISDQHQYRLSGN